MAVKMQSTVNAKQLEEIGDEFQYECITGKRPESCHFLGDFLETVKKDYEKASNVYRSNCDDYGYAESCLKTANYSFLASQKTGSKESSAEAFKYYEKGCELNNAESCLHAGVFLVSRSKNVKDVKPNLPKGLEYLNKSCESLNANACFYLSGMHLSGVLKSDISRTDPDPANIDKKDGAYALAKDMQKAFLFSNKACELHNWYACANVAQMYAQGEGTDKNLEKSEEFKKLALELQTRDAKAKLLRFHHPEKEMKL